MAKSLRPSTLAIIAEAEAWVEKKRREGWTRDDFVQAFKEFLENPDAPTKIDGPPPSLVPLHVAPAAPPATPGD